MNTTLNEFFATPTGKACAAFARVFAATVVGAWVTAGQPLPPTGGQLADWVQLGIGAAAALVLGNALGPWEKRYGVGHVPDDVGDPVDTM